MKERYQGVIKNRQQTWIWETEESSSVPQICFFFLFFPPNLFFKEVVNKQNFFSVIRFQGRKKIGSLLLRCSREVNSSNHRVKFETKSHQKWLQLSCSQFGMVIHELGCLINHTISNNLPHKKCISYCKLLISQHTFASQIVCECSFISAYKVMHGLSEAVNKYLAAEVYYHQISAQLAWG